MHAGRARSNRPYWHPDAKWITGLVLFFVLGTALAVFNLVQISAAQPAINSLGTALALAFSPQGLDDPAEVQAWRQQLAVTPERGVQPIPGLEITVFPREIDGLSPRETRLFIFRRVALPLYLNGRAALTDLTADPALRERLIDEAGLFGRLHLESHQWLRRTLIWLGGAGLALLIPLMVFSYGFGRVASPGWVLLCASLPGAAGLFWAKQALPVLARAAPPAAGTWQAALQSTLVPAVWPPLVDKLLNNYLMALAAGALLILIAQLGAGAGGRARARG